MKTLNPNTKKAKAFIEAYKVSRATELFQVYDRYSPNKGFAIEYCRNLCYGEHGCDLRILSANTFNITCGWRFGSHLRVETKNNNYIIPNAF